MSPSVPLCETAGMVRLFDEIRTFFGRNWRRASRAFAKQENLNIVDVFIEKQSAKISGRPIFGEMLKRIEKDEADGILAWHPDRLARNSVDGGQIIYLIDCGRIAALKFPQF